MGKSSTEIRSELVPGTLEMLILSTLIRNPMHGYGIARRIEDSSGMELRVEEGSLYPALQRMLRKGWVTAEWAVTENKRQARYYRLTRSGRKQLGQEVDEFRRVTSAIEKTLRPAEG